MALGCSHPHPIPHLSGPRMGLPAGIATTQRGGGNQTEVGTPRTIFPIRGETIGMAESRKLSQETEDRALKHRQQKAEGKKI